MASFEPRECQKLMIEHIMDTARPNIWGDPGIGKTAAVLAALDMLWLLGSKFHPALVIAPKRVARDVWAQEATKWDELSHLKVVRILGDKKDRAQALKVKGDVYVINYENVLWLVEELRDAWPFKIVVADESTKLKNFRLRKGGKRAAALAKISKGTGRWINLTGTPASNGLIDLWGQSWFLDRGQRLGRTFTAYKNKWFIENEYTRSVEPREGADDEIPERLSDITLSLSAEDYFDLPDTINNHIRVSLPAEAQRRYDAMEDAMFSDLEVGTVSAANAAVASSKCVQIATGAVYIDEGSKAWEEVHTAKIEALHSLLNDLSGEPLLCAYHFKPDLERLLKAFPEAQELKSEKSLQDWREGRVQLGIAHPDSIGHGLNDLAVAGRHIVFFGLWWNLESYLQIVQRIGATRQAQLGRKEPVFIHSIIAEGTIDEEIIRRREGKESTQKLLRERVNRKRGLVV